MQSDNEEIRSGNETVEIINWLLKSFVSNYQNEEKILRKGSDFVFESVDSLSYHIHKTSLKSGNSYIKSPKWILNKRATINPKNNDNKCFQYSITAALNHQNIENHPERISNIKPFIDKYNWKDIDFPARIKDWEKFEKNNKEIALNIIYTAPNKEKIKLAYKSKYNRKRKNQVVLLMITNGKQSDGTNKLHYIVLKSVRTDNEFDHPIRSLSRLFRAITSKIMEIFIVWVVYTLFKPITHLKKHERLCDNHGYCHIEMPTNDNNTLKYIVGKNR